MSRLFLALCLVALTVVAALPTDDVELNVAFSSYLVTFNKSYGDSEVESRLAAFSQSLAKISELNSIEGEEVYGLTKFSDMTPEEFKSKYLGYVPTQQINLEETPVLQLGADEVVNATNVDWRTKGMVTPVKDQAQCGSCWAFSATEEIESAWLMAGNKQQILAPQQIVSCDKTDDGCDGGDTPTAYKYVKKAGGMVSAKTYPYSSGKGKTGRCKKQDLSPIAVKISGFSYATTPKRAQVEAKPSEDQMATAMASKGPVSVCVDAESWQNYKKGVVTRSCKKELDHCVQAVGYNKEGAKPYWIVRNSWNTDWGIDGYIYVGMGGDYCGIADEATIVKA